MGERGHRRGVLDSYLGVEICKERVPPRDQSQLIDLIDALATLLALSLHPMPKMIIGGLTI